MNNQQVQKLSFEEQMKQEKIEESRIAINQCYDNGVRNQTKVRLPEEVFRSGFLDFFTGKAKDSTQPHMAQWIAIAGAPTAEVDVVNHADEVLFTVPPMMNTSAIELKTTRGTSMAELMKQYNERKNITPHAGNNFAATHFTEKAEQLVAVPQSGFTDAQQKWSSIFQFYGVHDPIGANKAAATSSAAVSNTNSDFDYD